LVNWDRSRIGCGFCMPIVKDPAVTGLTGLTGLTSCSYSCCTTWQANVLYSSRPEPFEPWVIPAMEKTPLWAGVCIVGKDTIGKRPRCG